MTKARKVSEIIEESLRAPVDQAATQYRGREIEFFRERGRLYPEKLEEIFWAIFNAETPDLVVIGPRGGGKTMVAMDGATALFKFKEFDVYDLAGSAQQAGYGFKYVRDILYKGTGSGEGELQEGLKTMAVGARGNWFKMAASSQTTARGAHPGDLHPEMDWASHGGLLIKDERDEMDDEVADAADFSMDVAEPSIILTTSTMHRADGGGIAQMAEEAEARGARVIKYDVFDVSEVCPHDCAACPGGHAFAGALFGAKETKGTRTNTDGHGRTRTQAESKAAKLELGVPRVTAASRVAWEVYKKAERWPDGEPAYCEGRAKGHRGGHYKMDKIFRAYRRSRHKEIFEVEMCCRRRRGARSVVDVGLLDRCLVPDARFADGYETVGLIDWGFKGWCVVIALQAQHNRKVVVDVEYLHLTPSDDVWDLMEVWRDRYGIYRVAADSSHPYENNKGTARGFEVTEVAFVSTKELGAGWIRGMVERGELVIPGEVRPGTGRKGGVAELPEYLFRSDGARELHRQLKKWRRDKNGKIVKADDHGPDSLLCGAVFFAAEEAADNEIVGSGRRESFGSGVVR